MELRYWLDSCRKTTAVSAGEITKCYSQYYEAKLIVFLQSSHESYVQLHNRLHSAAAAVKQNICSSTISHWLTLKSH